MIATGKHIPRRTILRGLGAGVALPFLDAMVPAFGATPTPVRRFVACYVPMGFDMSRFTPPREGPLQLTPAMMPLTTFKENLVVLTGLDNAPADITDAGPHQRVQTTWLTGFPAVRSEGSDIRAGISVDQVAAQAMGQDTLLPSLELAIESVDFAGACGGGYSCIYNNTISWSAPTAPLPCENNPRVLFERLFGASDSTDPRVRMADMQQDRSILDSVTETISSVHNRVGPSDRNRLDQYLESVRAVEQRIQKAEQQVDRMPVIAKPDGTPPSFEGHVKLMFDLLVLAFQSDVTRVATFLMSREQTIRSYPEIGVPDSHHPLSHHSYDAEKLVKLTKINTFQMSLFAYFLERLASTQSADGSLLDGTLVLYGSGMSDSHLHWPCELPAILVAGGATGIQGNQHHVSPAGTPFSNFLLTLLDRMNVPADHFGDATGLLSI